jgi:N-acetylglutamate synthase-like GNAT family acetyltransferase
MADVIRPCTDHDLEGILEVINDAAQAYKGVIPTDRYKDPYMPREELEREIEHGVRFWGFEQGGRLLGVMGLQDVEDVTLIRHAYVRTMHRRRGIGGRLLKDLRSTATRPPARRHMGSRRMGHRVLLPARVRDGPAGAGAAPAAPLLVRARAPDRDVRGAGREGLAQ